MDSDENGRHVEGTWYLSYLRMYLYHADDFKLHVNQHQRAKCRPQAQLCSPVSSVLLLNWRCSTNQKYIFKQCSQCVHIFFLECDWTLIHLPGTGCRYAQWPCACRSSLLGQGHTGDYQRLFPWDHTYMLMREKNRWELRARRCINHPLQK